MRGEAQKIEVVFRPTSAWIELTAESMQREPLRSGDGIWLAEAFHRALVSASDPRRESRGASVWTGVDHTGPLRGHRHAHWLPCATATAPQRIAGVMLHAPMGLDPTACAELFALRRVYGPMVPPHSVRVTAFGGVAELQAHSSLAHAAPIWRSVTPWVAPRHPKPRGHNTVAGLVQRELAERGFPAPVTIEQLDRDGLARPLEFGDLERAPQLPSPLASWTIARRRRPPPVRFGLALRLTFAEPVQGPLCLGYAAHFGLGLFSPERE